ncbi:MAG: TauD/TfdA family dioxygenase [Rhizobiaceae bacterium]|nr:MAG: TauD/TfdA family dioxygenase [Rhizobiaceae bacterium]
MSFDVTNLTPRIGAQIHTDLATMLSGSHAMQIRELLDQRGVLVFRDIHIDDEQQIEFTRTLGTLGDGIYKVTFDEGANGPIPTDYNYGNFSWHIDRTDIDIPPLSSILSPRKLTETGGETEFASTYAAYADLSDEDKARLDTLRVVHEVGASFRHTVPNPTAEQKARWDSRDPKEHPLIWHHRSGRKSLVTSTSAVRVVGMDKAESDALLDRLMAWASRPEYVYVHDWRMGDLVMWDNTGTMHRVRSYDMTAGRRLHRTTLLGEEPVDPVKAELVSA